MSAKYLTRRVYLLFGYVDLYRRTQLAYLGERADRSKVTSVHPVQAFLVVVALAQRQLAQLRAVEP